MPSSMPSSELDTVLAVSAPEHDDTVPAPANAGPDTVPADVIDTDVIDTGVIDTGVTTAEPAEAPAGTAVEAAAETAEMADPVTQTDAEAAGASADDSGDNAKDSGDDAGSAEDGAGDDAELGPTFAELGLPAEIVEALERRGVRHAFPIQAATLPDAIAGRDVLGRGRTGSGKTLAFGLPMITRLNGRRARARRPLGLVLVPTRELAMQVHDALEPYGRVLDLRMKTVCGGMSMPRQIMALERGVEILVATPGRLQDLVDRGDCALDDVQIAVLDEADQMADMGFLPDVSALLDLVKPGGQRMLFSATLDNGVDSVVERYLSDPVTHSVDPHASAVTTMTHHLMMVTPKDKVAVTAAIAARRGRTMVFVRTKFGADRVASQLREAGVRAEALHGGMTQGARTRTLAEYKEGRTPVLVATDVAARGIHVDGIDLVLHVDPAADSKDYLHRAGRTARAGEEGTVVTLVLPHQRRTVDRLMDDAGVEAQRLKVQGTFDAEMRKVTGARTLAEVKAQSVADAAEEADREAERLAQRIVELRARAEELRAKAAELAEQAKAEDAQVARSENEGGERRSGWGGGSRGDRGDRGDRGERRGGPRGERGGRGFDRDRGGDRGERGGFDRDRGGERRGGPRGERSFDRPRGERPYGERQFGDRPRGEGRPSGDGRPSGERRFGDRPAREDRFGGERRGGHGGGGWSGGGARGERGDRPFGNRERFERRDRFDGPREDRPRRDDRPEGGHGGRRFGGGDRPQHGGRSFGERSYGDRPYRGDRPRRNY